MNTIKGIARLMGLVALVGLLAACGAAAEQAGTQAESTAPEPAAAEAREELTLDEQLIAAVNAGDAAEVEQLLAAGADANAVEGDDFFSNPILRSATMDGNAEIATLLIANGADANARDSQGNGMLRRAITGGYPEIAAILIEAGADATAVEGDGNALLPMAVQTGELELVNMLLDAGAEVQGETEFSLTTGTFNVQFTSPGIHIAAARGNNDILQLLIDNGADVDRSVAPDGINMWQPLTFAAVGNQVETIELLVENGADIEGTSDAGHPLIAAINFGHPEATETLIALGADVNRRDEYGNIALLAARNAGRDEIVQILLEAGAEE